VIALPLATLLAVLPLTPGVHADVVALHPPAEVDPFHDAGDLERAFRDNLGIQLWGRASVRDGGRLAGQTADQRVGEAADQLGDAAVAFWLERAADRVFALYVVGRRRGRAVVDVFTLPGGDGGETDSRGLALKVSEALDALLFEPTPAGRAPWIEAPRQLPADRGTAFELGVGVWDATARRSPAQETLAISVARRRPLGSLAVLELAAEGEIGSGRQMRAAAGTVDTSEGGFGVAARALLLHRRWLAGGYLAAGVTTVAATGITAEGSRGERRLWIPTAGLGADLRLRLSTALELRIAGEVGGSAERHRLAVNEQPVLDLGRFYVASGISLVFLAR